MASSLDRFTLARGIAEALRNMTDGRLPIIVSLPVGTHLPLADAVLEMIAADGHPERQQTAARKPRAVEVEPDGCHVIVRLGEAA